MRTHAAGTFAMNCGFHGIPCVGYGGLDTQVKLHPLTTVEIGDLQSAKRIASELKNDNEFYTMCSNMTKENFEKYYTEKKWKENWNKQWR